MILVIIGKKGELGQNPAERKHTAVSTFDLIWIMPA